MKQPNVKTKCSVDDCENKTHLKGMCIMHYTRYRRHGDPTIVKKAPAGEGTMTTGGYSLITVNGRRVYEHVYIAEKALGKPLPPGADVHHINGKPWDNRPENLVICPSRAYHMELHQRQRELGIRFDESD